MKIERETIVKIELSESEAGDLRAILALLFVAYREAKHSILEKYHLSEKQESTIKKFEGELYE